MNTDNSKSFLENGKYFLGNIEWHKDSYGDYWQATFFDATNKQCGITGTLYNIEADGKRLSREAQELELKKYQPSDDTITLAIALKRIKQLEELLGPEKSNFTTELD